MASSSLATGDTVTKRGIWGWMLFDWAAQPFFTVVTTFIFGPYFVARLTEVHQPGIVFTTAV
ncbi:MAG: hypothetical protein IKG11_10135 [Atopobiaceae bacterium]|nr:hypothetical protein [Atopobiaceae bacterium]